MASVGIPDISEKPSTEPCLVNGDVQTQPTDSAANIQQKDESAAKKEERLRVIRERQAEELKRRLEELQEAASRAQEVRRKQEEERRRKIEEMKRREEEHRAIVEERRKRLLDEENERRQALIRKTLDREAKMIEMSKPSKRISGAFFSAVSVQNIASPRSMHGSTAMRGGVSARDIRKSADVGSASAAKSNQSDVIEPRPMTKRFSASTSHLLKQHKFAAAPPQTVISSSPREAAAAGSSTVKITGDGSVSPAGKRGAVGGMSMPTTDISNSARRSRADTHRVHVTTSKKSVDAAENNNTEAAPISKSRMSRVQSVPARINHAHAAKTDAASTTGHPGSGGKPASGKAKVPAKAVTPTASAPATRTMPAPPKPMVPRTVTKVTKETTSKPSPPTMKGVVKAVHTVTTRSTSNAKPKSPTQGDSSQDKTASNEIKMDEVPAAETEEAPQAEKTDAMKKAEKTPVSNEEEEYKNKLTEKRRLAREKAEKEAEDERRLKEEMRLAEEERLRREEEEQRRREEEEMRLAEEAIVQEKERYQRAVEETERKQRDEELRLEAERKERLEAERKSQEESEKREKERLEKAKREEEERQERKKRLESIMKRVKTDETLTPKAETPLSPSNRSSTSDMFSMPDVVTQTDSTGQAASSLATSVSDDSNTKFRSPLLQQMLGSRSKGKVADELSEENVSGVAVENGSAENGSAAVEQNGSNSLTENDISHPSTIDSSVIFESGSGVEDADVEHRAGATGNLKMELERGLTEENQPAEFPAPDTVDHPPETSHHAEHQQHVVGSVDDGQKDAMSNAVNATSPTTDKLSPVSDADTPDTAPYISSASKDVVSKTTLDLEPSLIANDDLDTEILSSRVHPTADRTADSAAGDSGRRLAWTDSDDKAAVTEQHSTGAVNGFSNDEDDRQSVASKSESVIPSNDVHVNGTSASEQLIDFGMVSDDIPVTSGPGKASVGVVNNDITNADLLVTFDNDVRGHHDSELPDVLS